MCLPLDVYVFTMMVLSERSLELYTLQAEPTIPTFPPYVIFLYFLLSPFPRNGRLCQLLALCLKCHCQKTWTGFHAQQQQQYQTIKNISSISRLSDFCQNDAHFMSVKRTEGGEVVPTLRFYQEQYSNIKLLPAADCTQYLIFTLDT